MTSSEDRTRRCLRCRSCSEPCCREGTFGQPNTSHANELPETAQYHRAMDMNFRVSEDGDRRPGAPIAKAHTSESVLYGQVAGSDIQCHRHRQEICAGLEFVMSHDAELLKRLENA